MTAPGIASLPAVMVRSRCRCRASGGGEGDAAGAVRLSVTLPADLPEALRDQLEMYLDRPFVNSGGARYLPPLGDEDLLVEDFDEPPLRVGTVELPTPCAPNTKDYRNEVARRLRKVKLTPGRSSKHPRSDRPDDRSDLHPVASDPDLRSKVAAAGQADRIEREIAELERRVSGKNLSLAKEFDRVLAVLTTYGYIDRATWTLTEAGEMLARTFHESDLLVTEVVRSGILDGLDPSDLAALVSMLVYEHRSSDTPPAPWFSSDDVRSRARRLLAVSEDLRANERAVGLAEHRPPDPTFAAIAHAWVAGEGFAEVVGDDELTGGDFVRTTKQLIDLLRQLALIAPHSETRRAAASAATRSWWPASAGPGSTTQHGSRPTSHVFVPSSVNGPGLSARICSRSSMARG